MKTIDRRLNKLEHRLGIVSDAPRYLVILMDAGQELGPAEDAYIKNLDEAGRLPTSGFGVVDLIHAPGRSAVKHNADDAPTAEITIRLV
jgi:hypothetical protein